MLTIASESRWARQPVVQLLCNIYAPHGTLTQSTHALSLGIHFQTHLAFTYGCNIQTANCTGKSNGQSPRSILINPQTLSGMFITEVSHCVMDSICICHIWMLHRWKVAACRDEPLCVLYKGNGMFNFCNYSQKCGHVLCSHFNRAPQIITILLKYSWLSLVQVGLFHIFHCLSHKKEPRQYYWACKHYCPPPSVFY